MNARFRRGLVIGKFYPPHAGHFNLMRAALRQCEEVDVQVLGSSAESISMDLRVDWIKHELPMVHVSSELDDEPVDYESDQSWEAHVAIIRGLLAAPVDAVFTSDGYGEELARRLSATWVQVAPARDLLHLSGTRVRANVERYWWALSPHVRAWFVRRVVVVGAESTGTTTLANDLAEHYGVEAVPEFGRTWSEQRPGGLATEWETGEFDLIAREQARAEDAAASASPRPLIICDTDALATSVWHERYVGRLSPSVDTFARARVPDLYLLTGDEIPFVQDGLRDGEHIRPWMTRRFREVLDSQTAHWHELSGSRHERLARAITLVDALPMRAMSDPLPQSGGETYA